MDMDVAQDRSNTDTLLGRVDEYFNDHGGCEMEELFGPAYQEPNLGAKDSHRPAGSAEMNSNNKRRLFSSQETPPAAAFTEAETAEARNFISPNTLRNEISEQVKVPLGEKPNKKEEGSHYCEPAGTDDPCSGPATKTRRNHVDGACGG